MAAWQGTVTTSVATRNDPAAIDERPALGGATRHGRPLSPLSRLIDACWYGRSIRAQLLLTVILIELMAALIAGGVTIIKARTSTRIEIDASMNLAEVLVRETINLMPQDTPGDRFLESLPLQQRFARHVRITVRDAAGYAVTTRPMQASEAIDAYARTPAPAWFASLISPPIERRELPVVVKGQRLGSVLIAGEPADEIAEVWENLTALATVAMLVIGWIYMAVKFPVRLPQQTVRFAPPVIDSTEHAAQVMNADSTYDEKTDTLLINVAVKNTGTAPLSLKQYIMAMATFVNGGKDDLEKAGPAHYVGSMQVQPDAPIAPGQTGKMQLKISSPLFDEERLIPLHDPQERIAGLLRFTDAQGHEDLVTLQTDLVPTEFRPQYLP